MDIHLFVLILQIGFNTALNYRNTPIPSAHLYNNEQTRRFSDNNRYLPLSPSLKGISDSDSEQSDFDYTSSEDTIFRSLPSLKNPYQRRNNRVRYDTVSDNEASLELAPFGRIGSNNHVESLQTSPKDKNFRRPYLTHRLSNLRQSRHPKNDRKENNSLEVSPIGSLEDVMHPRGDANFLRSLSSLMAEQNNRRDLDYKQKGISNYEFLKDPVSSLTTSRALNLQPANKRRNNRMDDKHYEYDVRFFQSPSDKKSRVDNADAVLFVVEEGKPDEQSVERRKLRSPELKHNKHYNRRDDDDESSESDGKVSLEDNTINNYIPSFIEIKPLVESLLLANDSPESSTNDSTGLESLLNKLEALSNLDEDDMDELKVFRLSDLEDLAKPQLRSRNEKYHNIQNDHNNFLRLLLSPIEKITLNEYMASDTLEEDSETSDDLNFVPANLRRRRPLNKKNSKREENYSMHNLSKNKLRSLRFENLDNLNAPLRNRKPTVRSTNKNLRKGKDHKRLKMRYALRKLLPYHELRSQKNHDNRRNKYDNRRDDNKFIPESLYNEKVDYDDSDFDDSSEGDLSIVRSTSLNFKPDNLRFQPKLRSLNENNSSQEDTTDTLIPENNQLNPENDNETNGSAIDGVTPELRNPEQKGNANESSDTLQLEFPWNDLLSPDDDKNSDSSNTPEFNQKLRSHDSKDNAENATLDLEFPWNNQLSPNDNKNANSSVLRGHTLYSRSSEETDNNQDSAETLHLDFPWNDQLTAEDDNKFLSQPKVRSHNTQKDKDNEHKHYHDKKSLDEDTSVEKKADPVYEHPILRQNRHQNYHRPSNNDKSHSLLKKLEDRSNLRQSGKNNNENNLRVLSIARNDLRNATVAYKSFDDDDEDPGSFITFPLDRRPHPRLRNHEDLPLILSRLGPQLLTRNKVNEFNRPQDKVGKKTFNDTLMFSTK